MEIDTQALLVDLPAMERNLKKMSDLFISAFDDLTEARCVFAGTINIHEPDLKRADSHCHQLETYFGTVQNTLSTFYTNHKHSSQ